MELTRRCVALFSGGLDSQLAVRLMQNQGIEVLGVSFQSVFTSCRQQAEHAARQLGISLTTLDADEDYLQLIRRPRFGYGRGANPCVDCRIYMVQMALRFAERTEAHFVVTGEVVGQRTMSQKRRDLETVAHHCGQSDLLLRPLSAKLLPPTLPERSGWVDREQLHGFFGRGRRKLLGLARSLGLRELPVPSSGCALTETHYARKVFDLLHHERENDGWDFTLLACGRHFRFNEHVRVVVGRREADNMQLEELHRRAGTHRATLLVPEGFRGPHVLVTGPLTRDALDFACGLLVRYARPAPHPGSRVRVDAGDGPRYVEPRPHPAAQHARTVAQPVMAEQR